MHRCACFCVTAVSVVLSLTLSTRVSYAQEPCQEDPTVCGKREFDLGIAEYQKGRFGSALRHFRSAQELTPHPAITFNLALAELERGFVAEAAFDLQAVIDDPLADEALKHKAREQLTLAESRTAVVSLDSTNGITTRLEVDGEHVTNDPDGVRLNPGLHWIKVTAGGKTTVDHSVKLASGERLCLAVGFPAPPAHPPPEPTEQRSGLPPAVAYVGAGLTIALTGVAIWSGIDTLRAHQAYERDWPNLTREQSRARLDAGHAKELRTNLLIGGAVLVAVSTVAVGWLWVDWRRPGQHTGHNGRGRRIADATVGFELGPAQVSLVGQF